MVSSASRSWGRWRRGTQTPVVVNPCATEPRRAEGQACLGCGITSSLLRAEHGYPVLCLLPVSWSCATPEDRAPWGQLGSTKLWPGAVVGSLPQGVSAPRAGLGDATSSEVLH